MTTTIDLNVSGTSIDVDIESPIVQFELDSPVLNFDVSGVNLDVGVSSPALEVSVETVELILPISGAGGGSPGGAQIIWGEIPSGTIDGINKTYASSYSYSANQLAVFLNGLRQRRLNDYTETGNQSFSFVNAPLPGDSLSIDYVLP